MQKFYKLACLGLVFALVFRLGGVVARAEIINGFTGAFAPSAWTLEPDQGQVSFNNTDTQLGITGPTGNFSDSYDEITLVAPAQANPGAQWPVSFQWTFNAGDALGASASIYWPGAPGGNPVVLASGGPGAADNGLFSLVLNQGDTVNIILDSGETGAGKLPATLTISDFTYSVPDATPWIEAAVLLPLVMRRYLPGGRRPV